MHLTRIRWFDPVILQKFNTAGEWKQKESVLTFCTSTRAKLVSYSPRRIRPLADRLKVIPLIGRSEGCALSVNGYRLMCKRMRYGSSFVPQLRNYGATGN